MSRDDPSSRFDVAAQVPYFAQWDNDGAPWIVGLPGPVDRVLARLVDGEGVKRFESVPATGDWPEDPTKNVVAIAADVQARRLGVAVNLRVEKGLSAETGLCDDAVLVAAVAAVAAACGDTIDTNTQVTGASTPLVHAAVTGHWGAAPEWTAVAVLFVDTKAEATDFEAAIAAGVKQGAMQVLHLPPSTVIAGCSDTTTAKRACEAIIETFAMRGVWSRGRAGTVEDRCLTVSKVPQNPL